MSNNKKKFSYAQSIPTNIVEALHNFSRYDSDVYVASIKRGFKMLSAKDGSGFLGASIDKNGNLSQARFNKLNSHFNFSTGVCVFQICSLICQQINMSIIQDRLDSLNAKIDEVINYNRCADISEINSLYENITSFIKEHDIDVPLDYTVIRPYREKWVGLFNKQMELLKSKINNLGDSKDYDRLKYFDDVDNIYEHLSSCNYLLYIFNYIILLFNSLSDNKFKEETLRIYEQHKKNIIDISLNIKNKLKALTDYYFEGDNENDFANSCVDKVTDKTIPWNSVWKAIKHFRQYKQIKLRQEECASKVQELLTLDYDYNENSSQYLIFTHNYYYITNANTASALDIEIKDIKNSERISFN